MKNKVQLVNSIVSSINKYNLDGINVDLENLTEDDRESYVEFVKLLKEKMPSGKSVSVAVAANPYGWNNGWQGSYDYERLAQYSDYIMLMAYDEHYEGGIAGSVAGIDFVENSIKYALQYVDKSKLVLGIPFFGRYWQNGASVGGYGATINQIENIIQKYDSIVTFDELTASAKAIVTIKSTDVCPVINGRALKTGTYTFWYENEESLTKKLELINKYDLKGCGSWSLGQENANTWNYYSRALNGNNAFYDVNQNYWAYDAICYAKENAWVEGRCENKFEPEGVLTRAEFATIICRVLGYNSENVENYYVDIENHWAARNINLLAQANLMNGYENGLFMPDKAITREEVVKVLYYLLSDSTASSELKSFIDVSSDRWSYIYIYKLSGIGIINGYETNEFKPEKPITRAEFVTILKRAF